MEYTKNGVTRVSRRNFVMGAATAGMAVATMGATAHAEESADGMCPVLMNRQTLHGLEDSNYDPEQLITDEQIEMLLRAGLSAPSAVGATTLELVVVTDRDAMLPIIENNGNANELNTCPLLICIVEHDDEETGHPRFYQYDSGMAAMAMQVQASYMGIANCVMSMKDSDKEGNAIAYPTLGITEDVTDYHVQLMVSFGYPAVDAVTSASVDNYVPEHVHTATIEG